MAKVGYLGKSADEGIVFEVSSETIRTLSNWKWSGSARYATHQRHNGHALTEFTGLDPDKITFNIMLNAELGTNPLDDIATIFKYEREAEPLALTIGHHFYGKYRWTIVSHESNIKHTDREGDISNATVTVTLQEYLRE